MRAHTHPWNRNTQNPCHLPVNVLYCRCHAPDVTNLPSVLQPSHSSFLKRSLRHVIAHYATQDSKNVIITNNNKTIACMYSAPSPKYMGHYLINSSRHSQRSVGRGPCSMSGTGVSPREHGDPALSLGGQASAWECSAGRSLCLTKSSACGRLWQFAHPTPEPSAKRPGS